jgi:hypothetical protein
MRILLLILVAFALIGCNKDYSEGTISPAVITKLSHKGIIKSWEGEAVKVSPNGDRAAEPWLFNVSDPNMIAQVQTALDSAWTVSIQYQQWMVPPPWIENDHVIKTITRLKLP